MISILLAALMQASAPPAPPSVWTSLPTEEDLAAFYPKDALAKGFGGRVVLACGVDLQGFLTDCRVDNEYPAGQGFGAAAMALQGKFRLRATEGARRGRKAIVRIPIRFEPPPQGSPPEDPLLRLAKPDWRRRPTASDFAKYYPERAARTRVSGMAVAQCVIAPGGQLDDCKVIYEDPPGLGFGDATLKVAKLFEAVPTTKDGASEVGRLVRIPIRFGFEGDR